MPHDGRDEDGRFTKGNNLCPVPFEKGNKSGNNEKYKPEYNQQVFKLCLLGATDEQIAEFFNVSRSTISRWKLDHPEFNDALRRGKTEADMEVADSLFHLAKGGSYVESVPFKVKKVNAATGKLEDFVETVEVIKVVPPNVAAASKWLASRRTAKWNNVSPSNPPVPEPEEEIVDHEAAKLDVQSGMESLIENAKARSLATRPASSDD